MYAGDLSGVRSTRCKYCNGPLAAPSRIRLSERMASLEAENGHNVGAHAVQGVARSAQTSPRATRFDFEQKA